MNVLLSFDIEEFDMPLEYGRTISFEEQIRISKEGTEIILNILKEHEIRATFFSTVIFAQNATSQIHRIQDEGHELASHGYYHSDFKNEHLLESKLALEEISGNTIQGFRMPRMRNVDHGEIQKAGYLYNSSLNPTYIPGRYNNLGKPRKIFTIGQTVQLPASTTPVVRFPLFWLSFHNLPLQLYKMACKRTINHDKYLNIYFHPWEFTNLDDHRFGFPNFIRRNSGNLMIDRFNSWIRWAKANGYTFSRINEFLSTYNLNS